MSTHPSSLQSIPSLLLNTSLHSYLLSMLNSLSTLTKLKTMLQTTWGKKSDLYAYRPWNICITGTNVKNCKYVVTYVLKCFRVSEVASELETFELSKINWILRKYFSMFPRFSAVYFNYLINYFTYLFFFLFFASGSYFIVLLAVLELIMLSRLFSDSEIRLFLHPECGD